LIEHGHQQGSLVSAGQPDDTVESSRTGGLRVYAGMTTTTRYSETAVSYGFQAGGTGISALTFTKHIGDLNYSVRFPGGTHSQWDASGRITAGSITGAGPIPVNDRFFGGNTVTAFIPGDSWSIPNGPLVRSIATNLLSGAGFGGTSFYSTNLTIGRVLFSSPMIPDEIEKANGFGDAVESAERTAETWFADDYEAASPEFRSLIARFPKEFDAGVSCAEAVFTALRQSGDVGVELDTALKEGEREARLSHNLVRNATTPGARGPDNANKLREWLIPESRFSRLVSALIAIEASVPAGTASQVKACRDSLGDRMEALGTAITGIESGSVRTAAELRARSDMRRPREVIDTLRHEANRFAFGLVAIFDSGRIWPDPDGTHYGVGGGGRFSLVNINMTVGYAVNPSPRKDLGQGRGAWLMTVTYTNLFR
jgi:hypothetical protein